MLRAKKDNKVVRIPDEKINEYKKLGYSIYSLDGELVYEHVSPSEKLKKMEAENAELKCQVSELTEKLEEATQYAKKTDDAIAKLEAENAELKTENARLVGEEAHAAETPEPNGLEPDGGAKPSGKKKSGSKASE